MKINIIRLLISRIKGNKLIDVLKEDFSILKSPNPFNMDKIEELKKMRAYGFHTTELVKYEEYENKRNAEKDIFKTYYYFKNKYSNYRFISLDTINKLCTKYDITISSTNSKNNLKLIDKCKKDIINFRLDNEDIFFEILQNTVPSYTGTYNMANVSYIMPISFSSYTYYTLDHILKNTNDFTQINDYTYRYKQNNNLYCKESLYVASIPFFNDFVILQSAYKNGIKVGFYIVTSNTSSNNNIKSKEDNTEENIDVTIAKIKLKKGKNMVNLDDINIDELLNSI